MGIARPTRTDNSSSILKRGRLAACGALLVLLSVTIGAAVAQAGAGGTAPPGSDDGSGQAAFGSRDLSLGMSGDDVKTLNWILNGMSSELGAAAAIPFDGTFEDPTDESVRSFQQSAGLTADGVVEKTTRKALAKRMPAQLATWYGRGFWGSDTACGKVLRPKTIGVASKKLPCGTKVTFAYHGHFVRAKVIDRGPYNGDYKWDLTKKLAKRLAFLDAGSSAVRSAVVR